MAQGSGIPSKTAIDQESITKNSEGEIQVEKPLRALIYDNYAESDWNLISFNNSKIERKTTSKTINGTNYNVWGLVDNIDGTDGDLVTLELSLDVSGFDEVIIDYYMLTRGNRGHSISLGSTESQIAGDPANEEGRIIENVEGQSTVTLTLDGTTEEFDNDALWELGVIKANKSARLVDNTV